MWGPQTLLCITLAVLQIAFSTQRINTYDGNQSTSTEGAEPCGYPRGYPAGAEVATYGDFMDSIIQANLSAYKALLNLP